MSEDQETQNSFLNNFDGYVLIFCAIILSALKVVELILKKKQNNNFTHLNTFENDLKKLQNDFVELSRIQTTDLSPELQNNNTKCQQSKIVNKFTEEQTKRFAALDAKASSKSASVLKKPDA